MGIFKAIGDALGSIFGGVDELITSDEERGQVRARIIESIAPLLDKSLEFERELLNARSRIIEAEVASKSFLASNWRPFSMLVLLAFVIVSTILQRPIPEDLWTLFQIGFGGYIGGRTVEKVAPSLVSAIRESKQKK